MQYACNYLFSYRSFYQPTPLQARRNLHKVDVKVTILIKTPFVETCSLDAIRLLHPSLSRKGGFSEISERLDELEKSATPFE